MVFAVGWIDWWSPSIAALEPDACHLHILHWTHQSAYVGCAFGFSWVLHEMHFAADLPYFPHFSSDCDIGIRLHKWPHLCVQKVVRTFYRQLVQKCVQLNLRRCILVRVFFVDLLTGCCSPLWPPSRHGKQTAFRFCHMRVCITIWRVGFASSFCEAKNLHCRW